MTTPATTFDSTREALSDLLNSIKLGKTQLPDFQRGWVWDDQHIRSLLASVSRAFPVGAVMMLQTGNPAVRFQPREVEGAPKPSIEPERLILDGQQRLTALFQTLASGHAVRTHGPRNKMFDRWYYVHIATALDKNADRESAIISVPEDRRVRSFRGEVAQDFSTTEKECAAEMLPIGILFDVSNLTRWQMKYLQADETKMAERLDRWNKLMEAVIQPFQQYQVPLILLRKETSMEAVCQVFEKVNTGGVSLTVFELLTATFAAEDIHFKLRRDWTARQERLHKHPVLRGVENTDLLQAVTLLATYKRRMAHVDKASSSDAPGVSCKRKDVLQLTLADFQACIEPVTVGFEKAGKFLMSQKFFNARDLPYRTQLVPMAAAFAELRADADTEGARLKLAKWFWCGVFGELYGSATETRFAKDLVELVDWIRGGNREPTTVADANFTPMRLRTLRTRNSAAYKGLAALLLLDGARDFRTGDPSELQTHFDESVDIHHIFPQQWCLDRKIGANVFDSVINKTPLAATTNRMIGANAPSKYLAAMEKHTKITARQMDEILASHVIDPTLLRADDFDGFLAAREKELLRRIEKAIGKSTLVVTTAQAALGQDIADTADEEMDEELMA